METTSESHKNTRFFWVVLALIAALALSVRLYANAGKEVWLDELFTLQAAAEPTLAGLYRNFLVEDVHPPLYNVLAWLTVQAIGYNHEALRVLSLAISMATLVALALGVRKWLGMWPALFSAFLFAVLQPSVYFAVEARAGALAMALGLWFSLAWSVLAERVWLNKALAAKEPLLLGLAGGLLALTSYPGLAFVGFGFLLLVALALIKRPTGWKWVLAAPALTFLLFAPWLPTFLYHLSPRTFWAEPVSFLSGLADTIAFMLDPYLPLYTLAGFVALTAARLWLAAPVEDKRQSKIPVWLAGLCAGFVVVLLTGLALANSEKFLPRMMLMCLPGVLIALAAGYEWLVARFTVGAKAGVAVAAFGMVVAVAVPSIRQDRLVPVGIRHNSGMETTAEWVDDFHQAGIPLAVVPYLKDPGGDINYGWSKESLKDAFGYLLIDEELQVDRVIETQSEMAEFCQGLSGEALLWHVHSPLPDGWEREIACQVHEVRRLNAGHALYRIIRSG
ncbi:MAG: glycosyltransferase family 39 protein [Fimbriimonadaceae bacterium]